MQGQNKFITSSIGFFAYGIEDEPNNSKLPFSQFVPSGYKSTMQHMIMHLM